MVENGLGQGRFDFRHVGRSGSFSFAGSACFHDGGLSGLLGALTWSTRRWFGDRNEAINR